MANELVGQIAGSSTEAINVTSSGGLFTGQILDLASSERIALKVEDGRLLTRGEPSARL